MCDISKSSNSNVFSSFYSAQNHKGQPQQRTSNDFNQSMHPNQTHQQRSSTNQLQSINEILMKSKSMLNNLQKNPIQMKVFPEDPPAPAQPPPKAAASNSASDKKLLKITLNRLEPEHIEQMGKSVSEFARNSPESAKKLGVIKDEIDMFSLIKADERNLKRKPENDVCPCESMFLFILRCQMALSLSSLFYCFVYIDISHFFWVFVFVSLCVHRIVSQPKLKRVCSDSTKSNHEDIQKSQTYQQFVRNMDNEIRRLQETEHFYNNGESSFHNRIDLFAYALTSIHFNCLFSFVLILSLSLSLQTMLTITMIAFRKKHWRSYQVMWLN